MPLPSHGNPDAPPRTMRAMRPDFLAPLFHPPLAGLVGSALALLAGGFILGLIVIYLAQRLFRD